jgi:hypothetical protein
LNSTARLWDDGIICLEDTRTCQALGIAMSLATANVCRKADALGAPVGRDRPRRARGSLKRGRGRSRSVKPGCGFLFGFLQ